MQGKFWTEKQIEESLESETRSVRMPDGSMRPITDFRVLWRNMDNLIATGIFTEERLVELTLKDCEKTGRTFEEMFPNIVACCVQIVCKEFFGDE